jgi:Icc-related predicted phosphoesterase
VLAASDVHGFADVYRWIVARSLEHQVDALLLAGDLLGVIEDVGSVEEGMAASRQEILDTIGVLQVPVLYIMGNDDLIDLNTDLSHLRNIHGQRVVMDDLAFVGYAGCPPFMGGPCDRPPDVLAEEVAALAPMIDRRTVLVTHYPARGILDAGSSRGGLDPLRRLIDENDVLAHVHGHIHQAFGKSGRHFNVSSGGRRRAFLIELPSLSSRVLTEEGAPPAER